MERAARAHHRRRLAQARAVRRARPTRRRQPVVRRRPTGAHGQRARGARRRRDGAAPDRRRDRGRALARARRGLAPAAGLRPRARQRDDDGARRARRGRRARPRARPAVGGRAAAGVPAGPRASCAAGARRSPTGTRIHAVLDAHERPFHCHHEKLVIVDDRVAFVSGIDMTALGGDRFDSPAHDLRELGWHDASSCLRGPAVADVAGHFRARWQEVAGEQLPGARRAGAGGRRRAAGRAHALRAHVRLRAARRLPDPRGVHAGAALGPRARLPREPVPVGARARRDPRREAAQPPDAPTSASSSCCRRRRTTAPTTPAASSACSSTPTTATGASWPARSTPATRAATLRPGLRAREDRDRRRSLADHRLGEHQRPLALQRRRGQRHHAGPRAGPRHAPATLGRAPRDVRRGRRRRSRPR